MKSTTELTSNSTFSNSNDTSEDNEANPGEQMLWFGKYKNEKRFEELPEDYVQKIMNQYVEGKSDNPPWLQRFYDTYYAYNAWLESRGKGRSPGSIKIWFGWKWTGYEMRQLLCAPNRWRWFSNDKTFSNRLCQIKREWEEWKLRHPKDRSGTRAKPIVNDPAGEIIGPRDSVPPAQESYESEDSFINDEDDDDDEDKDKNEDEEEESFVDQSSGTAPGESTEDDSSKGKRRPSTSQRRHAPQNPRKIRTRQTRSTTFIETSPDSDDEILTKQVLRRKLKKPPQLSPSPSSRTPSLENDTTISDEKEEENKVSSRKRRRRKTAEEDGDDDGGKDGEEDNLKVPRRTVRACRRHTEMEGESEDSDDLQVSPRKRRRKTAISIEEDSDELEVSPRKRRRKTVIEVDSDE